LIENRIEKKLSAKFDEFFQVNQTSL